MKLTAEKLFGMLEQLKNEGNDLSKITINVLRIADVANLEA
jgi:hypothetical protein